MVEAIWALLEKVDVIFGVLGGTIMLISGLVGIRSWSKNGRIKSAFSTVVELLMTLFVIYVMVLMGSMSLGLILGLGVAGIASLWTALGNGIGLSVSEAFWISVGSGILVTILWGFMWATTACTFGIIFGAPIGIHDFPEFIFSSKPITFISGVLTSLVLVIWFVGQWWMVILVGSIGGIVGLIFGAIFEELN